MVSVKKASNNGDATSEKWHHYLLLHILLVSHTSYTLVVIHCAKACAQSTRLSCVRVMSGYKLVNFCAGQRLSHAFVPPGDGFGIAESSARE